MQRTLRLMCILAHPDDETLGMGGILARYAAEGIETSVITATRGQYGWFGDPAENPGPEALGRIREAELRRAADTLGVTNLHLLDYVDGELDQANPVVVAAQLAGFIRRLRPHVVVTFGHDGFYGHPDHVAICQFASAAVSLAATPLQGSRCSPHRVAKLYYRAPGHDYIQRYEAAFGELAMCIEGEERRSPGWPSWTITTQVDATAHWERVWEAVQCHRSQLPGYERLLSLPAEAQAALWGTQEYYRALSLVECPSRGEDDLFGGLR
jgi:LmbE family N-acetylglucosaminyl deacetylase